MKREHIFAHYEQDASRHWKLREGGYATPMSVRAGERVALHISNSRSYYEVFVYHEAEQRLCEPLGMAVSWPFPSRDIPVARPRRSNSPESFAALPGVPRPSFADGNGVPVGGTSTATRRISARRPWLP